MPRICVLCGKPQSQSFSVFSFPSSSEQRLKWIRIILEAKPEMAHNKMFVRNGRPKNGICELHFLRSEISTGKKCRLSRQAIPSINISSSNCNSIITSYKPLFPPEETSKIKAEHFKNDPITHLNSVSITGDHAIKEALLPECTIQLEIQDDVTSQVQKSLVDNIFGEKENGVCLCCGAQRCFEDLFSVLKVKISPHDPLLVDELTNVFDVPKERIIGFSTHVCRKCLKIVEDMLELRRSFQSLVSHLKNKFLVTNKGMELCSQKDSCLQIDGDKASLAEEKKDSFVRKRSVRLSGKEIKFGCDECAQVFESLGALSHHTSIHENEISNKPDARSYRSKHCCKTCTLTFGTKEALKSHSKMHTHTSECSHCNRYISSKARLDYHLFKFHGIGKGKEKMFQCKSCERRFSSKPGLRYHEWALHKAGKPYTCELCHKNFAYRMLYNSHKLFAHGKKNIVCEICGQMFFTISKLNVHINAIHRNALSWICKLCNEKFTTTSAYRHHILVKHKQIIYKCPHCNVEFRKKYSLTQHLWKHNVFNCQRCHQKYDDSLSFVVHMNEIHKIDLSHKFNVKRKTKIAMESVCPDDSSTTTGSRRKGEVSSIVINDILIASNEFENSNLPPLSFQPENKEREKEEEFVSLSPVVPIHFDNVDSLEIQSVTNESMEMEEDVSLINVQMLEDIRHPNLKNLKSDIIPTDKLEPLDITNTLEPVVQKPSLPLQTPNLQPQINHVESNLDDPITKLPLLPNLTSSIDLCSSKKTNLTLTKNPLPMVSSLVAPHLEDLPVILKPTKSDTWGPFPNSLEGQSGPSLDQDLTEDEDPPVTREIDITIPSEDDEPKISPLPEGITNHVDKLNEQQLSALSVHNDGIADVHYKYVMYFDSPLQKS